MKHYEEPTVETIRFDIADSVMNDVGDDQLNGDPMDNPWENYFKQSKIDGAISGTQFNI